MEADSLLALDTAGEGFASCKRLQIKPGGPQAIQIPNCSPVGPRCTQYPYQCNAKLTSPVFIKTDVRPISSERIKWTNVKNPGPAFKPLGMDKPKDQAGLFFFERSATPKNLGGKTLLHGAWLKAKKIEEPEGDESYPASTYEHYGRALYLREGGKIKLLSEIQAKDGLEPSAFEPIPDLNYQWAGEPSSAPLHKQPEYYAFHKIYLIPKGFWLEIDWEADHEGAGASANTVIIQIIDGKTSELTSTSSIRMY